MHELSRCDYFESEDSPIFQSSEEDIVFLNRLIHAWLINFSINITVIYYCCINDVVGHIMA